MIILGWILFYFISIYLAFDLGCNIMAKKCLKSLHDHFSKKVNNYSSDKTDASTDKRE